MTSEPKAPGAPAIFLYRQVDRNDQSNIETNYIRIKVLTEEGRKRGDVEIVYFPGDYNIRNIKARTIRPNGTIINFDGKIYDKKVIKSRDLKFNAKTFTLPDIQVGSILEYRYTVEEDPGFVFDSHWTLNSDLFTRRAKFSIKMSEHFTVAWGGHRLPAGVTLPKKESSDRAVRMEVNDIPAYEEEEYSPPEDEVRAIVSFTYTTNKETDKTKFWKEEDKQMNQTVENFVGKHKEIAQAATEIAPASDPSEIRLRKLYEKVQSLRNTSYEVQKTEQEQKREKAKEAENIVEVWKKNTGTALQLNWLFLGLARAAGFQAFAVAVSPRDKHFFNPGSMNSSLLNYKLILVKDNGVDKYFDPGAAFTPFGLLQWPETDVNGLCLDKDGGTWVQTRIPASTDSRILRKAALKLDSEGTLSGKLILTFTGLEALRRRRAELNEDDAHRKNYLEQVAQNGIPAGSEAELTNKPDWTSSSREFVAEYNLRIPGWASGAGRKAFIPVGVFSNGEKHMFEHATRTTMVYFAYPYQLVDDITIELPRGWRVESLPAAQDRNMGMFIYKNAVQEQGGSLHLNRMLEMNAVTVDQQNYSVLRAIFQHVRNSDEQQIVVVPSSTGGKN